jgi:hypothetical protein
VWINTGIVLGVLFYGFIVLMLVAGFQAVLPLVILPPVVLGLIGANNLLGGGHRYGRSAGTPAPVSSRGPDGVGPAAGGTGSEELLPPP